MTKIAQLFILISMILFNTALIKAQKSKYNSNVLNINIGTLLYSKKEPYDLSRKSFDIPLTIEYQKLKKKNIFAAGLQFYHTYRDVYIDSNVYVLLFKKCFPKAGGISGGDAYCRYYFISNRTTLNIPISYSYKLVSNKHLYWFAKVGTSVNFNFYSHYNDTYPKLDPATGVLLDPGPFNVKYHFWQFSYQSYDVQFGSGINLKLSEKFGLTSSLQYQKSYERLFLKNTYRTAKIFLLLGTTFKI